VTQLKEIINERDEEIEILKAQLEVSKLRNDVLTKKLNRYVLIKQQSFL